jgi:CBS domain-containing protein
MQIKELMSKEVEVIDSDSTLQEAAEIMKQYDVGALPVWDGAELIGVITDRDIVVRAIAEGRDPKNTIVTEAMTGEVVYCFEDQDVQEASKLMEDRQIRRLVVLDSDRNVVGILSLGDIALSGNRALAAETLEKVSEPARVLQQQQS